MYAFCGCALLWSVQSLQVLSLTPLTLPTPIFQQFSIHILISSRIRNTKDAYFPSYGKDRSKDKHMYKTKHDHIQTCCGLVLRVLAFTGQRIVS
jgi:hypothetical protein